MCSHYGWTLDYVESLDQETYLKSFMAVDIFEAEKLYSMLDVFSYPSLKERDRDQVIKSLKKRLSANRSADLKTWTPEELAFNEAKDSFTDG
jgi:hypothetical protein